MDTTSHWTTNTHSNQSESKTKYADNAIHCFVFPSNCATSCNRHALAGISITGQKTTKISDFHHCLYHKMSSSGVQLLLEIGSKLTSLKFGVVIFSNVV